MAPTGVRWRDCTWCNRGSSQWNIVVLSMRDCDWTAGSGDSARLKFPHHSHSGGLTRQPVNAHSRTVSCSGSTRVSVPVFQSANQQGVIVARQLEKNTVYVMIYSQIRSKQHLHFACWAAEIYIYFCASVARSVRGASCLSSAEVLQTLLQKNSTVLKQQLRSLLVPHITGHMFIHRHLFLSKRFIHCLCESLNRSYTGALTDHKGLIYFPDSDLSRLQTEQPDDVVLVIDAFPDLTSLYVCLERPRTNYILGRSNHL